MFSKRIRYFCLDTNVFKKSSLPAIVFISNTSFSLLFTGSLQSLKKLYAMKLIIGVKPDDSLQTAIQLKNLIRDRDKDFLPKSLGYLFLP